MLPILFSFLDFAESCDRLQPKRIVFPDYDPDAYAKGDRRSAASGVSVDKHVSHDLSLLAPEVEEFMKRLSASTLHSLPYILVLKLLMWYFRTFFLFIFFGFQRCTWNQMGRDVLLLAVPIAGQDQNVSTNSFYAALAGFIVQPFGSRMKSQQNAGNPGVENRPRQASNVPCRLMV